MKTCYIVGASHSAPLPEIKATDFVIAADGGYDNLKKLSITPNLLIGDFDSISNMPKGIETVRHKVRKDETDMHLAYLEGAKRGYKSFKIYGGTGGRADHTFANYSLLLYIKEDGNEAALIDEETESIVIRNESALIQGRCGKHFSVFAFGGTATGVCIKNASYEAHNETLTPAFPLGVSNAFLDTPAEISVKNGALLVILEK